MISAIIRKIILTIPLLLLVSIGMFWVINLLPGDVTTAILAENASIEEVEKKREELGIDRPIYEQYWDWLTGFIQGDMGNSFFTGQPVTKRINERLPVTLEVILLSVVMAVIIGVPVGVISAAKRNTMTDYVISTVSMIGVAMPSFWLGIMLILLFSVQLGWLPASGYAAFSFDPAKNIRCMILPTVTLAVSLAAPIIRQTRSAMLDTLSQDYILTAKAKGLKTTQITLKHALRNALIPVITAVTSQISSMIGGAFIIETLFLLPGMGKSMVEAIYQRDYPIIMGVAMVVTTSVVIINMVTDIIYILVDPRINNSAK